MGFEFGPGLSDIGKKLARPALLEAILEPSAAVSFDYEGHLINLKDKSQMTGIITAQTETHISLKLMGGSTTEIALSKVASQQKLKESLMPNIFGQVLTEEQLIDLTEYLMSLNK